MNWQIPLIAKLSNNKSIHAEHIGILKNAKNIYCQILFWNWQTKAQPLAALYLMIYKLSFLLLLAMFQTFHLTISLRDSSTSSSLIY